MEEKSKDYIEIEGKIIYLPDPKTNDLLSFSIDGVHITTGYSIRVFLEDIRNYCRDHVDTSGIFKI